MTVEQLRNAHRALPFRPFALRMADGRSVFVAHPEFLALSPSGRTVIVHGANDSYSIIDLLLVNELEIQASVESSGSSDQNGPPAR